MSFSVEPPARHRQVRNNIAQNLPRTFHTKKSIRIEEPPLDGWVSTKRRNPIQNKVVIGWNGDEAIKCIFNTVKNRWEDREGYTVNISMWTESKV